MTVGSIVHEIFQIVLRRKLSALSQIRKVGEELLDSKNVAFQLYASQMTAVEARSELEKFLDNIFDFVEEYVNGRKIAKKQQVGLCTNLSLKFKTFWMFFFFSYFLNSLIKMVSMVKSTVFKILKKTFGCQNWA